MNTDTPDFAAQAAAQPDVARLWALVDEWELLDAGHYFADALTATLTELGY